MAAFARDTTNENYSFAVGLCICLSLDTNGKSRTPLDPCNLDCYQLSSIPIDSAQAQKGFI